MGDKSSIGKGEDTAPAETEVAGMKTEITDFIVTAFLSYVVFLLFSPKSQ